MKNISLALLSMITLFGCTDKGKENSDELVDTTIDQVKVEDSSEEVKNTANNDFVESIRIVGDSVLLPEFDVEISLSEKALTRLEKESIIVQAYFSGQPIDTSSQEYLEEGSITVGSNEVELWNSNIAKFRNVKISKAAYDKLSDKNFEVLINVYSGRHTTTDNLISCGIIQENIDLIKGKKHLIKGDLI